jgi:small subunit ribosomal protein S21
LSIPFIYKTLRMAEGHMTKKSNVAIQVNDNLDKALRQLKKKIEREGVSRDMKRVVYFESPTQKKRKRLIRAIKQNLIRMASQGLIDIHS